MTLPRFIVLKAPDAEKYLRCRPGNGIYKGYATFTEKMAVSADAKFEVEFAKNGLVHIRSCTKNKYLKRTHNPSITRREDEEYWITITADKPEEDTKKESCTLFKPILEDSLHGNYRFVHVQSGHYLCLWPLATGYLKRGVLANPNRAADNQNDIFKVIDWESLVILPKFVAFKGKNNMFLGLTEAGEQRLKFSCGDVGDHHVTMEVFYRNNGDIRIKPVSSDRFWRSSPNRIRVDSDENKCKDKDTHFRAFKVDGKTIALRNVGNEKFCDLKETTGDLAATVPSITKETYLCVLDVVPIGSEACKLLY